MKIKQKQKIIKINKTKQKQNITDYSLHKIIIRVFMLLVNIKLFL
jgi:hypothetical protein